MNEGSSRSPREAASPRLGPRSRLFSVLSKVSEAEEEEEEALPLFSCNGAGDGPGA